MYYELIRRIEDAMYSGAFENNPEDFLEPDGNSICSSEFYHLYDGSGAIAYQNLGYRILDIDKDGTRELLLGENSISEDEEYPYDGIIYDLYTIRDGEIIHLFGGWPRNRYYLTETDVIACEWDSSAFYYGTTFYQYNAGDLDYIEELIFDYQEENKGSITYKSETEERELYNIGEAADILSKYQYVYPEFIPIGPKWNKLEDIDGDGSNDYVIYTGREGYYNHIAIYLAHEGIVFEHYDELPVDVGDISQIDIDHDGENEILITMWPHVNSMPLEEYAVIKKTSSGWQELEGCADNAFPIHVYKDKEHYSLSISCDGFDKAILYDVEYLYDFYVEQVELNGAETYYSEVKNFYMSDVYSASVGSEVGEVCAYGIWNIIVSSYNGQTCLVAEHGIQGRDKCDPWGLVQVYFDYDSDGKIRILDLVHVPYMPSDTNEIVGDQDPIVSVNGVENSEYNSIKKQDDESALAAVLLCEKSLIFDGDEERMELMINDILVILEDYGAERKIYQFALVDLDNDSKTEVVLDVISVGNSGNKIILHEIDNEIYAYVVGSRTFWDLKSDGTYSFSATALTNDGCARIVEFSESLYVEKIIMSATGSYEGADKFIINDELVTESEYENAIKNQNSKVNVIWYDFNENNIRKCFEQ